MNEIGKYSQYFDIDDNYFPCIDDSAIDAGAHWDTTYPHEDFINLLKDVERMLGGTTKRSVWIHGAYGTGKSQCAYTLRKILEVSEEELDKYWNKYPELQNYNDLLTKIKGHKERGILVVTRYASGDILNMKEFFRCIQESVKDSLVANKCNYLGESTLKDAVISWIDQPGHEEMLNILLKQSEWSAVFSQASAAEIRNALKRSDKIKELMNNIFKLAQKEGLTGMTIDSDILKNWLRDVIDKNDLKIVFIWDEFSDFFKNNKNSLGEFQKIIALCEDSSFFFIPITHQTNSIISSEDQSWSIVQQRFNFTEIKLPDNIAFNLIGDAFKVKPAALDTWNMCADDLNSALQTSRLAVMKETKISKEEVIKNIMPLHPMTAMVLKYISSAFKANQRSMFDFIKTSDTEKVKAFQWFIENYGPADDYPLLTIDMLWSFFYEHGRDNLATDFQMILDTYQQHRNIRSDEQRVLKTILIMQAIDKRMGGMISLLKPTEKNISYAFEGISSGLDVSCKNIAKKLKEDGILVLNPIGNNEYAYGAAVLAGDQSRIEEYKKTIRSNCNTAQLVDEGGLSSVLNMSPALKLRFGINSGELVTVTTSDFTRKINELKNNVNSQRFIAVLAFAKNESEALSLNEMIKAACKNIDYKDITFISALNSPLSEDLFNQYVEFEAMAQYYTGNNNTSAKENQNRARTILATNWKNSIYQGSFVIYSYTCQEGERYVGGNSVCQALQTIVKHKYPYCFEFNRGVSENALKPTQIKASAKCGIIRSTSGAVVNQEKAILSSVWKMDDYYKNDSTKMLDISIIKNDLDQLISNSFIEDGQISMAKIINYLSENYGFVPCNLYSLLLGFLLKEYSINPYRFADFEGSHEEMTTDKLSEMISNALLNKSIDTFIVRMTPEEKAFYELSIKAWGISQDACNSVKQAMISIQNKMLSLGQPIWCLEEVCDGNTFDYLNKYIEILQSNSEDNAHSLALSLGRIYLNRPSIADELKNILTIDQCKKAMLSYISAYKDGILYQLSKTINATDIILSDISHLFEVEHSNLWNKSTGNEQLDHLITDYTFIMCSNDILYSNVRTKKDAFVKWKEKIKFLMCSHETLIAKYPSAKDTFDLLLDIINDKDILPEKMEVYVNNLKDSIELIKNYLLSESSIFYDIYKVYLDDILVDEVIQLKKPALINIYGKSRIDSNLIVKNVAEEYRKEQLKNQVALLWRQKTNTKNPVEWSYIHKTPIMLMIPNEEFDEARKAFDVLNRPYSSDKDIKDTSDYLNNTMIFDFINNKELIDVNFKKLLGKYCNILNVDDVRTKLSNKPVEPYYWDTNPVIRDEIVKMAKAEYDAGVSAKIVSAIESMSYFEIKEYLLKLVKENIDFGVEIINKGE